MKNFKLILRSLLSNHACVEGGRRKAWYFAVPMFVLAMILALIPIFVQTWTRNGDSIVSATAYQMDVSTQRFLEATVEKGIDMKVENKKLIVDEEKWNATFTEREGDSEYTCYLHKHIDANTGNEFPDLAVYYIPSVKLTDDVYNRITTFPHTNDDGTPTRVNRTYSFYLFTEKNVTIYIFSNAKGNSIGTIYGDYESLPEGFEMKSLLTSDLAITWANVKSFYRDAYNNNRIKLAWQTTLMMFGINAGITIFMGFMLWVLTRGKNNLNWFGIWETQKIVAWTTVTPAILTTGLGFLISSFSQVMFPLLLGVRIMWLSMKLLRPENKDLYPPLKEKKVVDAKPVK